MIISRYYWIPHGGRMNWNTSPDIAEPGTCTKLWIAGWSEWAVRISKVYIMMEDFMFVRLRTDGSWFVFGAFAAGADADP